MNHCAAFPPIILLLPLLQASDHFEQGALGGGSVSVSGPANVLEMLDNAITILGLKTEELLGLLCWGWVGCRTSDTSGTTLL